MAFSNNDNMCPPISKSQCISSLFRSRLRAWHERPCVFLHETSQGPTLVKQNKTASFQKEAMRTQVALYFIMKWNLYRVVPLSLNKQNVQNRQVEKSLLLYKIVIRKKWLDLIAICLYRDTFFMTYHPSYTRIGHFMGRETVYCNLNSNMVEGVGCPVLAAR